MGVAAKPSGRHHRCQRCKAANMTEFQPPYFPPPFPSSMALGQHSELFQPAIPDPYQHFHQATAQTFPYRMALEAQQEQMQQEQEQTDYPENAQSAHQRELIKRELRRPRRKLPLGSSSRRTSSAPPLAASLFSRPPPSTKSPSLWCSAGSLHQSA